MQKNDNHLLFTLLPEDQQQLLQINAAINNLFHKDSDSAWFQLDTFVMDLIKSIEFKRIADSLPTPETYYRIALSSVAEPICVVMFVFKAHQKNGQVILLHTYNHYSPNDRIYSIESITNPIEAGATQIIRQTPPHTHKAICHSCIAWIDGQAIVNEQFYSSIDEAKVEFIQEEEKNLHQCTLDNRPGSTIHSISVTFC